MQGWQETTAQGTAQAPSAGAEDHCLVEGVDLNAFLSIRERPAGPPARRVAVAKKPWVRSFPSWGTAADAATAVYPAGYTPSVPKPLDDFVLKFLGVRIVQDIGTPQERSFSFGPEVLRLVRIEEGLPFSYFASPALPGLRPGTHTTTVFFRTSSEHCDGLGTVREDNCLPAGDNQYTGNTPLRGRQEAGRRRLTRWHGIRPGVARHALAPSCRRFPAPGTESEPGRPCERLSRPARMWAAPVLAGVWRASYGPRHRRCARPLWFCRSVARTFVAQSENTLWARKMM